MLQKHTGHAQDVPVEMAGIEGGFPAGRRTGASEPAPYMMHALHHSFSGRHEEAWKEAQTALNLDLVDPMVNFRVVQAAYYARRYELAIQSARTAIDLAPEFQPPRSYIRSAGGGTCGRGMDRGKRGKGTGPGPAILRRALWICRGQAGHSVEAITVIEDLPPHRDRGYGPALPIAWVYLGLEDFDPCWRWLETSFVEHEPYLAAAGVAPIYDPLRSRPAFTQLLRRLGIRG